jgi:hypothetical protein
MPNNNPDNEGLHLQLATDLESFRSAKTWMLLERYNFEGTIGTMQSSHNAAIYNIPTTDRLLNINECWCTDSLSRTTEHNLRDTIEQNIIRTISHSDINRDHTIRLINVGNDKVAILVLLSKLSILGYNNIDLINLEREELENYVEHNQNNLNYSNFVRNYFQKTKYSLIFSENKMRQDILKFQPENFNPAAMTMVFAEDLGGVEKSDYTEKYNNAINKVLTKLKTLGHDINGDVYYSKPDGTISMHYDTDCIPENTSAFASSSNFTP